MLQYLFTGAPFLVDGTDPKPETIEDAKRAVYTAFTGCRTGVDRIESMRHGDGLLLGVYTTGSVTPTLLLFTPTTAGRNIRLDQAHLARRQPRQRPEPSPSRSGALSPTEEALANALQEAKNHLDFIGWGDGYERECATDEKLPEVIDSALKLVAR